MTSQELQKLSALCRKFGGTLVHKPFLLARQQAPFTYSVGLDYKRKEVWYTDDAPVQAVIHEMGHIFACKKHPRDSDEVEFFGWEFVLATEIGAVRNWRRGNRDYVIDFEGLSYIFGELTRNEADKLLAFKVEEATKAGLIVNGHPVAIR